MARRFNFTGRLKIKSDDVRLRLVQDANGIAFEADLAKLGSYDLNPAASVFVEAYRGSTSTWKRFDFGRVASIAAPTDLSLNEFSEPDGICFRVKVTETSEGLAKILAEGDGFKPKELNGQEANGVSLLHTQLKELNGEAWKLDFSDKAPVLLLDSKVPQQLEFAKSSVFRSLVMPQLLREILLKIVNQVDEFELDDDDAWQSQWLKFTETIKGAEKHPVIEEQGLDIERFEQWVDNTVSAFARVQAVLPQLMSQQGL